MFSADDAGIGRAGGTPVASTTGRRSPGSTSGKFDGHGAARRGRRGREELALGVSKGLELRALGPHPGVVGRRSPGDPATRRRVHGSSRFGAALRSRLARMGAGLGPAARAAGRPESTRNSPTRRRARRVARTPLRGTPWRPKRSHGGAGRVKFRGRRFRGTIPDDSFTGVLRNSGRSGGLLGRSRVPREPSPSER